jgi:predicted dehydrogenase
MERIRWGMVGGGPGGLIGEVHRIAARITDEFALLGGVFSSDFERAVSFARGEGIDGGRVYRDVETLIEKEGALPPGERIQGVTLATPNRLHFEAASALVQSGFHVVCEKPVTCSVDEARRLERLVADSGVVFAVAHAYTGYPMIRQMKRLIADGAIGEIHRVDSQYYQGWINPFVHDRQERRKVWRLDPGVSGPSCCVGDIGSHSFNLIEYVTGARVARILADLNNLYDDNPLDVDANILARLDNGSRGVIRLSQIAAGEENNLTIQVYGRKGGLIWEQENPNRVLFRKEGGPSEIYTRAGSYNRPFSLSASLIPPGHPEGLLEAFAVLYRGVARAIREGDPVEGEFPTIHDGVRAMRFVERAVESSRAGSVWLEI